MGYSDPRPNVMPLVRWGGVNPDNAGERSMFGGSGSEGVANSKWAAGLRPSLYTPSKYEDAARARGWASPGMTGAPVAASATATAYAYKHAAATSQFLAAGNVYDRLTDHRGYTGLHRHRFDVVDGRGLGMRGRDDAGTDSACGDCCCPCPPQRPLCMSTPSNTATLPLDSLPPPTASALDRRLLSQVAKLGVVPGGQGQRLWREALDGAQGKRRQRLKCVRVCHYFFPPLI
jgi:hypothetical protein